MSNFPTLYSTVKRGNKVKETFWRIEVSETDLGYGIIRIESGDTGGKIKKMNPIIISKGKNIGKSNETTPYEQALKEAQSRWEKKAKVYSLDQNAAAKFYPMLLLEYNTHQKKIVWPAWIQPKLDGIRAVSTFNAEFGIYALHRKKMTPFEFQDDFTADLTRLHELLPAGTIIDGEIHGPTFGKCNQKENYVPLQDIAGTMSRIHETRVDILDKLVFHVFDIYIPSAPEMSFGERFALLREAFVRAGRTKKVQLLITEKVADHDAATAKLREYVDAGYEGAIIRNDLGQYKPSKLTSGRTSDVLKYKLTEVDDLEIRDITETPSTAVFGILIHVMLPNGNTLPITGNGTKAYQHYVLANKDTFIGCRLRFEYHGMTEDLVPKFARPVLGPDKKYILSEV